MLLTGISIRLGVSQVSKDLRAQIGASFDIRPYEQLEVIDGQVSSKGNPTVDEDAIQHIIAVIGNELKQYNTEHTGYVKGKKLSFVEGAGHSGENNMGEVTAVRESELSKPFLNEEYKLIEGNPIKADDKNQILINEELAKINHLHIGDKVELTHAELGIENGEYVDLIQNKSVFEMVEVKGIFASKNSSATSLTPTAKRIENVIFSDDQLLTHLQEQEKGVYEGEISFFITDPQHLDDILQKVKNISSIDWENHLIKENEYRYSKISEELNGLQKLVTSLILIVSVLGIIILMLMMTLQFRGRLRESGILLAIGKSKKEIIGQFVLETITLLFIGFFLAMIIFIPFSKILNSVWFESLAQESTNMLQRATDHKNYLQRMHRSLWKLSKVCQNLKIRHLVITLIAKILIWYQLLFLLLVKW